MRFRFLKMASLGPKTLAVYLTLIFPLSLKLTFPSKCPWMLPRWWSGYFQVNVSNTSNSVSPVPSSLLPPFHPATLPPRLCWSASPYRSCHPHATPWVIFDQGVCVSRFAQDCSVYVYCLGKMTDSTLFILKTILDWTINYMVTLFFLISDSCSTHQ